MNLRQNIYAALRSAFLLAVLLGTGQSVNAQPPLARRVVFIGNAEGRTEVISSLRDTRLLTKGTTVVFLGNSIGKGERDYAVVDSAAALVKGTGATAIFLPGEEEWERDGKPSLKQLKDFGKYINALDRKDVRILPEDGCPGPQIIELGNDAVLLFMDSQWWLEDLGDRPGIESKCDQKTDLQVLDELDDLITANADKLLLFAAPHTLRSTGVRAGYFEAKQHLFPLTDIHGLNKAYLPLPVVGSLYPVARSLFIGRQDAVHERYRNFSSRVDALLKEHPFAIRAGAGAHVMQLYEDDGRHYVVSGTARRTGRVSETRNTPYVALKKGFAVLEISAQKKVSAVFYELEDGKALQAFSKTLLDYSTLPTAPAALTTTAAPAKGDSVTAAIYPHYDRASGSRRWLLGENYRKEWGTPITLPVFHLRTTDGGYKIVGKGGGNTTTAIRVEDNGGTVWSLRSILKKPEKVMPEAFRATAAEDVMQDIGSAAHPFAGIVSNGLADAAGLPRPRIRYYFVPDDTALGVYRPAFANTVASLEERAYSRFGADTKGTWNVFNRYVEGKPMRVDQRSFLRGRLMDFLIADYDRHYAQWKWEARDSAGIDTWYAVPKDRDQALYRFRGALMRAITYRTLPYLKGLQPRIKNIRSLGFVARDVDGFFLNELEQEDWEAELASFRKALPDAAISKAVRRLPEPVYAIRGEQTEESLRARRDDLPRAAMIYYQTLAEKVRVTGTDDRERFEIVPADSGDLTVRMYTQEDKDDTAFRLRYERTFHHGETQEVRLFGLGGDDTFRIAPGVPRGIRLRLVGGGGEDVFDNRSRARTWLYDTKSEENVVLNRRPGTINMISNRDDVNDYIFREDRTYNTRRFPQALGGFNVEDGVLIGVGATYTRRGFRVQPYKSLQRIAALIAPARGAYQLRYTGVFNDAYRHFDVLAGAAVVDPALQNFYGLGNETVREPGRDFRYYRVRYSYATADLAMRRRLLENKLSISLGPTFFHYWHDEEDAEGRVLENPEAVGLNRNDVFTTLLYAGGRLSINFQSIDNLLLPTRGARWITELTAMSGLNDRSQSISRFTSDLEVYAPLSNNNRFVTVLRGGGGHILSNQFEYFQAITLGANNALRGFRKSRFAGSSALYGSAELRARLFQFKSRLVPGDLGLSGFGESGRVWLRGEESNKWHKDIGAGIYYTPFNVALVSLLVSVSEEDQLMNLSVGAGVNLTF